MGRNAKTIFVKMQSTAINPETGKPTGYHYTTKKNPKSENTQGKMEFRKYDPVVREHAIFKETKLK